MYLTKQERVEEAHANLRRIVQEEGGSSFAAVNSPDGKVVSVISENPSARIDLEPEDALLLSRMLFEMAQACLKIKSGDN